ncbi:MAG: PSD1 and planctomycete cytochrome C domain-containing protein [Verrucomicrobiota bacterium]
MNTEIRRKMTLVMALFLLMGGVATGAPDYAQDIRPLLSDRCIKCHGPGDQKGRLRLDSREAALKVIDLESPENSELLYRLTTDVEEDEMPPKKGGTKKLTPEQVELFQEWVLAGAPYDQHWAYEAPEKDSFAEGKNPVDHFVQERLTEAGLEPNPPADPAILLRRLSLDLTGLPPTVEEVDAFLAEPSEESYENQVERLLASPHFGEKWALRWLDLARYADSNGYQHDDLRTMWPWRDWVIRALNADMPYDQFTMEQVAGDLLPNPSEDQLIATAFHRNTPTNFSGGSKVEEVRASLIMDRVNVTGQVWLGATMECAACHDHKFDPITQRDYYEMYAFFNRVDTEVEQIAADMFRKRFIGATVNVPPAPEHRERLEELRAEKKKLWNRITTLRRAKDRAKPDKELLAANAQMKRLETKIFQTGAAVVHVMKDAEEDPGSFIFERGSYLSPGDSVDYGTIDALHSFPADAPRNRLGLAQWLVSEENPLVARVAVNRWWAELFGRGIVETLDDFGMQSAPPSHPELLDWLAVDFVEKGWSLKALLRTLVTSTTYRQSAAVQAEAMTADPENRLLWRAPRHRLPAELIRDNALAVSGLLHPVLHGPPVFPPQPKGLWKEIAGADVKEYPTSTGLDRYRRGLYVMVRRGNPHPSMTNFDAGDRSLCVTKRPRTNTPIQALTLLNDPNFVEAAEHFSGLIGERPGSVDEQARWAFRRVLSRHPSHEELDVLLNLYAADSTWFDVAQTLLNTDESVCR